MQLAENPVTMARRQELEELQGLREEVLAWRSGSMPGQTLPEMSNNLERERLLLKKEIINHEKRYQRLCEVTLSLGREGKEM